MKKTFLILTLIVLSSHSFAASKTHPCAKDAIWNADKLLRLHFDQDSNSTNIENLGIENRVSIRPSILAPSKKGKYEVLEVLGYIYKADYRMRFTYARLGKTCILMGQEILEMSNPF
ncbi:MAG: hypothetical protein KBD76_00665 [Bacteriovorax sp.]|nr:hypothetical protein [Bacteriovorax sp.]